MEWTKVLIAVSRVASLCFVVLAIRAIHEVRAFLQDKVEMEGDTVLVPLVFCEPASVQMDGSDLSVDAEDGVGKCITLDFLVDAGVSSLILSSLAVAVYLLADSWAQNQSRYYRQRAFYDKSALVHGMGLFLSFVLLQTGFCIGALLRQANFWLEDFEKTLEATTDDSIEEVLESITLETPGNTNILLAVVILAFSLSFIVVAEHAVAMCLKWREQTQSEAARSDFQNEASTRYDDVSSSSEMESQPKEDETSVELPGWVNSEVL